MAHPLDGVGLNCDRARDHLDALEREFDAFERDAYRIRHDVERFGREHVYRVKALRKTRPQWGPVIGDCLHNAASALDHLAYQLAILHTGPLPPDLARDTHFPIYESPRATYVSDGGGGLGLLVGKHATANKPNVSTTASRRPVTKPPQTAEPVTCTTRSRRCVVRGANPHANSPNNGRN